MKEEKRPYVWGITVKEVLYVAECYDQGKKVQLQKEVDSKEILNTIENMQDLYEAYKNELLIPRLITQAAKLKEVYEDLPVGKFKVLLKHH